MKTISSRKLDSYINFINTVAETTNLLRVNNIEVNPKTIQIASGISKPTYSRIVKELQYDYKYNGYECETIDNLKSNIMIRTQTNLVKDIVRDTTSDLHIERLLYVGKYGYHETKADERYNLLLYLGLPINSIDDLTIVGNTIPLVLSSILVGILKDHYIIFPTTSFNNSLTYSTHLYNYMRQSILGAGKVSSQSTSLKYLLRHDGRGNFARVVSRGGSYQTGIKTKPSHLTKFGENKILDKLIKIFTTLELEVVDTKPTDLIIEPLQLTTIVNRDIFMFLSYLKGKDNEGNYVIDYASSITDEQESRQYNIFTSIKSDTRKMLGYYNYDISACLQTIAFEFVESTKYPQHKRLVDDKHSLRGELANCLGKDLKSIKTMLSASDNGKLYATECSVSSTFKQYREESESMVDDFLNKVSPDMLVIAKRYAKPIMESYDVINKHGIEEVKWRPKLDEFGYEVPKKFSLFFFVWTQIERVIRESMVQCFSNLDDVRQVHDAVYSKEKIDYAILEQAIVNATGMTIKIEG